ncbi:hypothetical protein FY528_01610 [Hymenobacter lutimineralis]|uniref:TraB/GumN family protein n=1 Tax=Hymenobacter lutimineralis TaxID=2606448 RepID=A0A5D6VH77_9BACT|nr:MULTISPECIES: hypothetical protein [Hymenobacter]QIX60114.1 hypothetical protein HER32_02490 [Hymenobacter sp. BT18]TYZ14452.1 hypothetical protein FY528_01610 [Hymenobacter lutimineralis]
MKQPVVLLLAALWPATAALAQITTPQPCDQQLRSYATPLPAKPAWTYTRALPAGGSVYYFGAEHSQDAAHAQFARIKEAFAQAKPTVVLFEGPNRGADSTETATIARLGESGYVRFLAKQQNLPVESLENPVAEYQYLKSKFDLEQLKLFYLLREAQRLRTRTKASPEQITKAMETLLAKSAQMLPGSDQVIRTVPELAAAYQKYWPAGGNWWEAPAAWFDPMASSASTGGKFTNDINRASSEFRNLYMYRLIADKARAGQRVFAVVGRNHVPAQAPALDCALSVK